MKNSSSRRETSRKLASCQSTNVPILVHQAAGKAASRCLMISMPRFRRIRLPRPFAEGVDDSGFIQLPIGFDHAAAVELLPSHHSDPFDRMIVAQAKVERLVVVTRDRAFEPYGVPVIWT